MPTTSLSGYRIPMPMLPRASRCALHPSCGRARLGTYDGKSGHPSPRFQPHPVHIGPHRGDLGIHTWRRVAGTGTLPDIIRGLQTCGEEQAAFLTGIMWEITAETPVAEAAVAVGAVTTLLHVISRNLGLCKIGEELVGNTGKGDRRAAGFGRSMSYPGEWRQPSPSPIGPQQP